MPLENILPPVDAVVTDSTQLEVLKIVENFSKMPMDEMLSLLFTSVTGIVFKLLFAALLYFVGKWLIGRATKFLNHLFELRQIEISLSKFILSLVRITLYIILILTTVNILGINTTSFLAIFASAGLAVGMALSGTLQNFAGGVLILFLKPYKIGDFIEAQGYMGTVKEISLFSTLINTIDNKMVIIPNGSLSTGIINNFSKEPIRRAEWIFGVAYGTDYDVAKKVLFEIIDTDSRVLKGEGQEIFIALHALADSSVNIIIRAWTSSEDFWPLYFDINERVYKRLNEEGIGIPFPQMDVHVHNS